MASNKLRSGEKRKSLHEAIREIDGNEAWFKLMQDGKTDEAVESLLQGIPKKTTKFSKTSAPKAKGQKGAAEAGFEVSILPESLQSYHDTMYQRFIEIVAKVPEQTVRHTRAPATNTQAIGFFSTLRRDVENASLRDALKDAKVDKLYKYFLSMGQYYKDGAKKTIVGDVAEGGDQSIYESSGNEHENTAQRTSVRQHRKQYGAAEAVLNPTTSRENDNDNGEDEQSKSDDLPGPKQQRSRKGVIQEDSDDHMRLDGTTVG